MGTVFAIVAARNGGENAAITGILSVRANIVRDG